MAAFCFGLRSPLLEIALVFVRLDHVAAFSRNPIRKMRLPNFVGVMTYAIKSAMIMITIMAMTRLLFAVLSPQLGHLAAFRASGSVWRDFTVTGAAFN